MLIWRLGSRRDARRILEGKQVEATTNPALEVMLRRRSIRKFTSEPVSQEQESLLLQAAFSAPSSTNARPWHFIVVRDAERRSALAALHDYTKMLVRAPLVIAVLGHPSSPWWIEDCSAATQCILLEATELGLGSIWCGVRIPDGNEDEYYPALGIDAASEWRVLSLVGIGHPAESKPPRTQVEVAKVSYESFGSSAPGR
jgi:nitroreductase